MARWCALTDADAVEITYLDSALERIKQGAHTATDLDVVRRANRANQITTASPCTRGRRPGPTESAHSRAATPRGERNRSVPLRDALWFRAEPGAMPFVQLSLEVAIGPSPRANHTEVDAHAQCCREQW